jgi:hypothetical protein
MELRQIISEFFDHSIRAESVLHLGTMCMDDAWPSIASDAFEFDCEEVWQAIGIADPESDETEELSEYLRDSRKFGFLIQFATPVPQQFYENGHSFSWSSYTTKWIYDEVFSEACRKAIEWNAKYIEEARTKAESSNGEEG